MCCTYCGWELFQREREFLAPGFFYSTPLLPCERQKDCKEHMTEATKENKEGEERMTG